MDDKAKLMLIRKMLENCLAFDGDRGQAIEDVLCVIGFGEETEDE